MKEKQAEVLYEKYLKNIYTLIGDKTTYLSQVNGAGKQLLGVKFKGVFSSDRIPMLNDLTPYCILNLDASDEPGSHWIALAKGDDNSFIYDSFGRDYKRIIPRITYSGNGRIYNTDRDIEQKITETDCGARSLAWLVLLDKHGWNVARLI